MAGTPRKEGGVQLKVTLKKPTLAANSITSPGTSGGGEEQIKQQMLLKSYAMEELHTL